MASMSSSSSKGKARPFAPGEGFQSNAPPKPLKQPRLASLDKKSIVTPRASSSSSASAKSGAPGKAKGKSTQPSLKAAFKHQTTVAASSSSPRVAPKTKPKPQPKPESSTTTTTAGGKGKGKENARVAPESDDDDVVIVEPPEDVKPSAWACFTQMMAPSATGFFSRRRAAPALGRAIVNPAVVRPGPAIQFDEGDEGEPPSDDEMEMVGEERRRKWNRVQEGRVGQLNLVPEGDHEGFGEGSARRKKKKQKLELEMSPEAESAEKDDVEFVTAPDVEDGSLAGASPEEPDTLDDDYGALQDFLVPPPVGSRSAEQREPSSAWSASASTSPPPPSLPTSVVFAPNTLDDDDLLESLAGQFGAVDDSGYAGSVDDDSKETWGDSVMANDEDAEAYVEDTQPPFPSLVPVYLLGRSLSSLLMPPPPLPNRAASSAGPRVLAPDTPSPPAASSQPEPESESIDAFADFSNLGYTSTGRILVPETQEPVAPRPPRASAPVVYCEETQTQTPTRFTSTSASPPARKPSAAAWDGLAAAWEGQHVEPPRPLAPRQASLSEFFNVPPPPGELEDEVVVEDSQFGVPMTLEEAYVASVAFDKLPGRGTARESSREGRSGEEREEEEVEDSPEPEPEGMGDDDLVIPSSDPEDGPWPLLGSPPGTPERLRSPSPLVFPSPGQAPRVAGMPQGSQQQAGETQWESYWSVGSYLPPPPESFVDDMIPEVDFPEADD